VVFLLVAYLISVFAEDEAAEVSESSSGIYSGSHNLHRILLRTFRSHTGASTYGSGQRPGDAAESKEDDYPELWSGLSPSPVADGPYNPVASLLELDKRHPDGFDVHSTGRIVGGSNTEPDRYPYLATLQVQSYPICGAFLIKPDVLLTAAHCYGSGFNREDIGRWNLHDSSEDYESFHIQKQIMHPDFTYFQNRRVGNDFMLLKLFGSSSQPTVRLNPNDAVPSNNGKVTVMEWGRTSFGGSTSSVLKEVDVNVISNSRCKTAKGTTSTGGEYNYSGIIEPNNIPLVEGRIPAKAIRVGRSSGPG